MPFFPLQLRDDEGPPATPLQMVLTLGWTVDFYINQGGIKTPIYRNCSLDTLARASSLFERIAVDRCSRALPYGQEPKVDFLLASQPLGEAFVHVVQWICDCAQISFHSEDPQVTLTGAENLTQLMWYSRAANELELKEPLNNQRRLTGRIRRWIKMAFDHPNFQDVSISNHEIMFIWGMCHCDEKNPIVKLLLECFVDAYDIRFGDSQMAKDGIITRFDALVDTHPSFHVAALAVKHDKDERQQKGDRPQGKEVEEHDADSDSSRTLTQGDFSQPEPSSAAETSTAETSITTRSGVESWLRDFLVEDEQIYSELRS